MCQNICKCLKLNIPRARLRPLSIVMEKNNKHLMQLNGPGKILGPGEKKTFFEAPMNFLDLKTD